MPVELPPRRPVAPPEAARGAPWLFAVILVLGSVAGFLSQMRSPTPGYALAPTAQDIQLSP